MSYPTIAGLRNGVVAIVSLNPAASTAFVDPELNQAASTVKTGKYVAILSGLSVDQDGNALTNMYFIGPGMPVKNTQYDEDESMCIPLSPAQTHPLRRRPLQPLQPLPWSTECYVRTVLTERQVRISSAVASKTVLPIILKDTDIKDLIRFSEVDLRRTKPAEIVMRISDDGSNYDLSGDDLGHGERDEGDGGWLRELNSKPVKLFLTFDVWLDTSMLPQLPDPSSLRTELERLYILQDQDTRRHYTRYRRAKRTSRQEPQPESQSRTDVTPSKSRRGLRSWISRLFRKIFRKRRVLR